MDAIQRAYAHTAWTKADPLAHLAPEIRLAILLMPPNWGERLRLAPWRNHLQRRLEAGAKCFSNILRCDL